MVKSVSWEISLVYAARWTSKDWRKQKVQMNASSNKLVLFFFFNCLPKTCTVFVTTDKYGRCTVESWAWRQLYTHLSPWAAFSWYLSDYIPVSRYLVVHDSDFNDWIWCFKCFFLRKTENICKHLDFSTSYLSEVGFLIILPPVFKP